MKRAGTIPMVLAILGSSVTAQAAQGGGATPVAAWGDLDGDGRPDLALASPRGDRLLRNRGDGGFDELPLPEAVAGGGSRLALLHDVDVDGRLDLYLGRAFPGLLLAGTGRGGFVELPLVDETQLPGFDVRSARFLDYDADGRVDLELAGDGATALFHGEPGRLARVELAGIPATTAVAAAGGAPAAPPLPSPPLLAGLSGDGSPRALRLAGSSGGAGGAGPGGSPGAFAPAPPSPGAANIAPLLICADTLKDQTAAGCLEAASTPGLGRLYPLSVHLNVDGAGEVGMGTTTPGHKLHVRTTDMLTNAVFAENANNGLGIATLRAVTTSSEAGALGVHGAVNQTLAGQLSAGVCGEHDGSSSAGFGVWGEHAGTGIGVNGSCPSGTGVAGESNSGTGVRGAHAASTGTSPGVYGETASTSSSARAVHGVVLSTSPGSSSAAVRGENRGTGAAGIGVWGSQNGTGWGVYGSATSGIGVRGFTGSAIQSAVYASGNFTATGIKSFAQPHPHDASKEIRFACLEGEESGTYFRGSAVLVGGRAVVAVPESFALVSEAEGLTVQLTARGARADLWAEALDLGTLVVRGSPDVRFDYLVNGVRRGFAGHEPIQANRSFVPQERGVPYGTQYPAALRRILVENGTLNPDFTPSEATAARLGWTLADPSEEGETVPLGSAPAPRGD